MVSQFSDSVSADTMLSSFLCCFCVYHHYNMPSVHCSVTHYKNIIRPENKHTRNAHISGSRPAVDDTNWPSHFPRPNWQLCDPCQTALLFVYAVSVDCSVLSSAKLVLGSNVDRLRLRAAISAKLQMRIGAERKFKDQRYVESEKKTSIRERLSAISCRKIRHLVHRSAFSNLPPASWLLVEDSLHFIPRDKWTSLFPIKRGNIYL